MRQLQIRPAIYGDQIRYEVYEVNTSSSFWSGSKTKYKQLYFELHKSEWQETDYTGWCFNKEDGKSARSFKSISDCGKTLKEAFGNDYYVRIWRPEV